MTVEESRALAVAIVSLRFNPHLGENEKIRYEAILVDMMDRM